MRWTVAVYVVFMTFVICEVYGKPGGHVTEERREYYQKTSKVIDTPIIYANDGGTHSSYTSSGDILSSSWAQSHMDEIRKMADKLRSEYNYRAMSAGIGRKGGRMRNRYSSASVVDFPSFAGKSQEELDAFTRQMTEQMINDMKSGKILYSQIVQPNYFETQAAQQLEAMSQTQDFSSNQQQLTSGVQQQNQDIYGAEDFRRYPQTIAGGGYQRTHEKKHYEYSSTHGGYQPVPTYATELEDLNRREEQSSVVYPSTVTIIGGNRYVTKKNCTTAGTTVGAVTPFFPNYRTTHTSAYDKDIQNILEHGRDIPIVVEQGQSTYNKEQSSYSKHQEQQSVPVYQGSYFTGNNYDSQFNQNSNINIPIQNQIQGQSTDSRQGSQYNRHYQTIPIGGSSQTIRTSSTSVRERENQQIPVVIPTSQTTTSTSDSYSQSETQRRIPVAYPSSSTHRESSSYESGREHKPVVVPTPSSSRHSIYKHLERESEVIPDYKPVVTIDSQTIDTVNQELNRYHSQRPSTIARTEEIEHVERNKQVQQPTVVPDVIITIHEQEHKEDESERRVQPVQPTIASSHQTTANDRQQSSSNVLYRPSYPAYGSQMSRNDTEYRENYQSRYPQPVVSGSTYEKHEEDQHYSREQQQRIPIYGQTSQNTEEIRTSETYRNREQPTPVVVGGSSTYQQESHEERYTGERQQPVPQTSTYQETHEEHYTGQKQHQVPQTTTYKENREEQYTSEQERQRQRVETYPQTSDKITESNQTTIYNRPGPIYISGSTSQQTESEDQVREATRYRQYPTGHRTSQVTAESEDAYWARYHARPQGVQTTQSETETEYRESSGSRYPQTGVITSQTTEEREMESSDLRHKPGQAGYSVTTHVNETSSSSSSGTVETSQHPVVVASSQETIIEGNSQSGSQIVTPSSVDQTERERNDSYVEIRDGKLYYPSDYERTREREREEYERNRQQGAYGGGMRLEHSKYGSHVNRSMATGGGAIGYITHQLTIEEQEELWRRQQEERRRQQLISTGIFEESSLNRSSSYGDNGVVKVNVAQQGVYDGDEDRFSNATAHLDEDHYGTSVDISSTSASGKPPGKIISKDRGDQPPQNYEEDYDMNEAEPGIGYYLTEPQAANQVVPSTTVRYPPVYTAPLAPLVIEKDKADSNKETTVEVWPTAAGETEVQRSYHRKKTTITQTIPVLIGPNGEVIQESGSSVSSNQQSGTAGSSQTANYQSSSGAYHSQLGGGATISNQNLIDQHQDNEQSYQQQQSQEQSYQSQSSTHQVAGGHEDYGSAAYGSEARYQIRPGASYSDRGGSSRYSTGSTSSSVSYQGGGSYSQASAYGHQQNEDDSLESQLGQQLTVGAFEIGDDQQTQDLTQQFVDDGEETENLNQGYEDYQQSHDTYSRSTGGVDQGQHVDGQSSSTYYKSQSAYSNHLSSSSGSGSDSGSSSNNLDQIPTEVHEGEPSDQNKPGFWRRIGQKAKDLFG